MELWSRTNQPVAAELEVKLILVMEAVFLPHLILQLEGALNIIVAERAAPDLNFLYA